MDKKEKFIEKALKVHAGENLDYSKVVYVNSKTPVEIVDHDIRPDGTEYGSFWQSPENHVRGQGHPDKRCIKIAKSKSGKQEEIIARFKEVHKGENLDYSQVKYVNMHTKVKIISHDLRPDGTEYGEFWQEPVVHLKGCTHPEIGIEKQRQQIKYTTEKFIEIAKKVHKDDDYSYDLVNYQGSQIKVQIVCNKKDFSGNPHGVFSINPDAFIQGKGCPKCGNHLSKSEDEIYDYITSVLTKESVIKRDKKILGGKELDILVPDAKIAFEFDGIRWHSEKFKNTKHYHLNKTKACEEKGITLIHIFEDEYQNHKELVLDKIGHILGFDYNKPRVCARQCEVKEISKSEAKEFLGKYHIQGSGGMTVAYGAYYQNNLIGVMTFISGNTWELNRFCTNINYKCPGIASKLFTHFVRDYNPSSVKSFLDRRWCVNRGDNLYTKLGFVEDAVLPPDYRYSNGHGERLHKFGFRKHLLNKKYGLPLTMTEREMTESLGYYKIWDCGLIRYVWTNP